MRTKRVAMYYQCVVAGRRIKAPNGSSFVLKGRSERLLYTGCTMHLAHLIAVALSTVRIRLRSKVCAMNTITSWPGLYAGHYTDGVGSCVVNTRLWR